MKRTSLPSGSRAPPRAAGADERDDRAAAASSFLGRIWIARDRRGGADAEGRGHGRPRGAPPSSRFALIGPRNSMTRAEVVDPEGDARPPDPPLATDLVPPWRSSEKKDLSPRCRHASTGARQAGTTCCARRTRQRSEAPTQRYPPRRSAADRRADDSRRVPREAEERDRVLELSGGDRREDQTGRGGELEAWRARRSSSGRERRDRRRAGEAERSGDRRTTPRTIDGEGRGGAGAGAPRRRRQERSRRLRLPRREEEHERDRRFETGSIGR